MEHFSLQPNESILYKGDGLFYESKKTYSCDLFLTNLNLVIVRKIAKLFAKNQTDVYSYPVSEIKIYNETPQIKQSGTAVEIYLTGGELKIDLQSIFEAKKFIHIAYELLTGKSFSVRGAEKVKGAVGLVDSTLGIDTVGTVKNVLEKGVVGTVFGGLSKKTSRSAKGSAVVKEAFDLTKNLLGKPTSTETVESSQNASITDEQIETIKKMKELLDAGVLTQEEFDIKKKDILGF